MIPPHTDIRAARLTAIEQRFALGIPVCGDVLLQLCEKNGVSYTETEAWIVQMFIVDVNCRGELRYLRPTGIKKYRLDCVHRLAEELGNKLSS